MTAHVRGFINSLLGQDAQRQFLDAPVERPRMSREAIAVADAIGCSCMTDQVCDHKGGCYCKQAADAVIALQDEPRLQP